MEKKSKEKIIPKDLDEKFTTLLLDDQVEERRYFYEEAIKLRQLYDTNRELWNQKIKAILQK